MIDTVLFMLSPPPRFRPASSRLAPKGRGQQQVFVRVRLRDDAHHVEIRAGVLRYRGEIMHAPGSVSNGDEVHLRVFVASSGTGAAADSRLVLLGDVISMEGAATGKRVRARRGVEFTMHIQRASIRGRDVAPGSLPPPVNVAPQLYAEHENFNVNVNANVNAGFCDDDDDATEILSQLSLASLSQPDFDFDFDNIPSDLAVFEDDDEDEDTLVMANPSSVPVSTVSPFDLGPVLASSSKSISQPRQESHLPTRRRADTAEFTGVSGRIERMGVVEVVQSLDVLRRTGRVEFYSDDGDGGAVFIADGQVTHAEYSVFVGRDAFVELLQFERGSFQIHFDRTSPERTIEQPTGFLILDCMTKIDEVRAQKNEGTRTAVVPTPVLTKERRSWLAPPI